MPASSTHPGPLQLRHVSVVSITTTPASGWACQRVHATSARHLRPCVTGATLPLSNLGAWPSTGKQAQPQQSLEKNPSFRVRKARCRLGSPRFLFSSLICLRIITSPPRLCPRHVWRQHHDASRAKLHHGPTKSKHFRSNHLQPRLALAPDGRLLTLRLQLSLRPRLHLEHDQQDSTRLTNKPLRPSKSSSTTAAQLHMSSDSKLPRLCVLEVRTYKKKHIAIRTLAMCCRQPIRFLNTLLCNRCLFAHESPKSIDKN